MEKVHIHVQRVDQNLLHVHVYYTYILMYMYMYMYVYVGKVFPPFSLKSCPVLEFESEPGEGTDMDSLPS